METYGSNIESFPINTFTKIKVAKINFRAYQIHLLILDTDPVSPGGTPTFVETAPPDYDESHRDDTPHDTTRNPTNFASSQKLTNSKPEKTQTK